MLFEWFENDIKSTELIYFCFHHIFVRRERNISIINFLIIFCFLRLFFFCAHQTQLSGMQKKKMGISRQPILYKFIKIQNKKQICKYILINYGCIVIQISYILMSLIFHQIYCNFDVLNLMIFNRI
jgi:hypothetical protein